MQQLIGWTVIMLGGILYIGQMISSVDFRLAQRLGLQEKPEATDPLMQRAERYVAYWDLVTLGWLPLAGVLMIIDHPWWPIVALIGGAIYFDTSGREAAKNLSFQHEGMRTGPEKQAKWFFATYIAMAVIAVVVMLYAIAHMTGSV